MTVPLDRLVLAVVLAAFTAAAAFTDHKYRKIPNKLTVTLFGLGLLYHVVFHLIVDFQPWVVLDGLGGFALGFGVMFLLWVTAGGGGGDVKLTGAVAVWLGFFWTLIVLVLAVLIIGAVNLFSLFRVMVTRGVFRTREHLAKLSAARQKHATRDSRNRPIMPFALSMMVATWLIVAWICLKPVKRDDVVSSMVESSQVEG